MNYNNNFARTTPSVNASPLQNVPANIRQILNSVSNLPPMPAHVLSLPTNLNNINNINNMMPIMVPPSAMSTPLAMSTNYSHTPTTTTTAMSTPNSPALSALGQSNQSLSDQLSVERTKSKTVERAYWSLRSEIDTVVKGKDKDISRLKRQNADMLRMAKQLRATHHENVELLKAKSKEANRKNNGLEKELKQLKKKERQRPMAKQSPKLMSSQSVTSLMADIRKYGAQFEALQKSPVQAKSTAMAEMVQGYKAMMEQLDVLKVQVQGDELESMTRDREYIALLEKERDEHAMRMEEYVRRNQKLQNKLAISERKLRQTQNTLNRVGQRQQQQLHRVFDQYHNQSK